MNAKVEGTTVAHIIMDSIKIPVDVQHTEEAPINSRGVIELVVTNMIAGHPTKIFNDEGSLVTNCNFVIGNNEKIKYFHEEKNHTYVITAKEFRNAINYNKFVEFVCDPEGNAILEPVMVVVNGLDMLEYYSRSNHRRKNKGEVLEPILDSGDVKINRGDKIDIKVAKKGIDIILRLGVKTPTKQYNKKKSESTIIEMKKLLWRYDFDHYLNNGDIECCEIGKFTHTYIRFRWEIKVGKSTK